MANLGNRIVVLIDMDCFFCQVEVRLQPEYAGKPLAVVQYNQWRAGGIIAVNYEARDFGVTRHMRGEEAKEKCPEIILAQVPCLRGKADTSRYRSAGREVIEVLKKHCNMVERASVDEAYLDITQMVDETLSKEIINWEEMLNQLNTTFIVGHTKLSSNDEDMRQKGLETWLSDSCEDIQIQRLAIAGVIVENLRKEIFKTTGFRCSAGISFNKILAKLACGLHKPNRQTVLPASSVPDLFGSLPIKKVRHLGGKLGDMVIDSLKCNVMGDLLPYSQQHLQNRFDEKTGQWLYNIARGVDNEPVTPRTIAKSIGACKRFPGKQNITDAETLKHWLGDLSAEVCERLEQDLEENERKATLLTISYQYIQNKVPESHTRSIACTSYKKEKMAEQSFNVVSKETQKLPITFLGISAGKFIKAKGSENFKNFFKTNSNNSPTPAINNTEETYKNSELDNDEINFEKDPIMDEKNSKTETDSDLCQTVENDDPTESCLNEETSPSNRKPSPCSQIKKTLKPDNFKKSFFMNILKEKQTSKKEKTPLKTETCKASIKLNFNEIDVRPNSDDKDVKNDNKIAVNSRGHKFQASNSSKCTALEKLKEIFPDLNDMDPSIVKLLPLQLQEEAKKVLKNKNAMDSVNLKNEENKSNDETNKSSRGRPPKPKPNNQKSKINNFFIKTDVNSSSNDFKKCIECGQLILVNKYEEHQDYHVARNLQREMNQTTNNDETRKRKAVVESPTRPKKRVSDEIVYTIPKPETLTSFFQ